MIRRTVLVLLVCVTALLALASPAAAHNSLTTSEPANGSSVTGPPAQLTLAFAKSVPLETVSIELIDASGVRSDLAGSFHGPEGDTHVVTPLPPLTLGAVNLRWRLVGPDGHPITGRIGFTIVESAPTSTAVAAVVDPAVSTTALAGAELPTVAVATAPPGTEPVDLATDAATDPGFSEPWTTSGGIRWFLRMISYLAIMAVGGVVATVIFVWPKAWTSRTIQQAVAVGIGAAAVTGIAQLLVVASDISADPPWSSMGSLSASLETDAGVALLVRLLLLPLLAWVMFSSNDAVERVRWNASAAIVIVLLGTWAYAGHSRSMRWPFIGIPVDIAHHAAAAAWLGGLAIVGLVVTTSPDRGEVVAAVQRFGKLAAVSVAVIVGTGLVQAVRLVGSPTRLFDADHGLYLVAKLIFLGIMLKVADVNRQRVGRRFREPALATPRIAGILRRAMGTELAIGVAVLGITAAMVVSPPASAQDDFDPSTTDSEDVGTAPDVSTTSTSALSAPLLDVTTTTLATAPTQTCVVEATAMRAGASGPSVMCLQQTLRLHGVLVGEATGQFDQATDAAVRALQQQRGLVVDGIVGQETATALGIWPKS